MKALLLDLASGNLAAFIKPAPSADYAVAGLGSVVATAGMTMDNLPAGLFWLTVFLLLCRGVAACLDIALKIKKLRNGDHDENAE